MVTGMHGVRMARALAPAVEESKHGLERVHAVVWVPNQARYCAIPTVEVVGRIPLMDASVMIGIMGIAATVGCILYIFQ